MYCITIVSMILCMSLVMTPTIDILGTILVYTIVTSLLLVGVTTSNMRGAVMSYDDCIDYSSYNGHVVCEKITLFHTIYHCEGARKATHNILVTIYLSYTSNKLGTIVTTYLIVIL